VQAIPDKLAVLRLGEPFDGVISREQQRTRGKQRVHLALQRISPPEDDVLHKRHVEPREAERTRRRVRKFVHSRFRTKRRVVSVLSLSLSLSLSLQSND
jgi:hypothetical protein